MKNKLLVVLLACISVLTVSIVKAEDERFALDWETQEVEGYNSGILFPTSDGYFVVFPSESYTRKIVLYDKEGNKKAEKTFDSIGVLNVISTDDGFYIENETERHVNNVYSYHFQILKLNKNLEIVATSEDIPNYQHYYADESMRLIDGSIYLLNRYYVNDTMYVYNEDLSSYEVVNDIDLKEYFPNAYFSKTGKILLGTNNINSTSIDGDNVVYGISIYNRDVCISHVETSPTPEEVELSSNGGNRCYDSVIYLYNTDEELIWTKELKGFHLESAKIIDDRIIVLAKGGSAGHILIYDLEGNLLQIISSSKYSYVGIAANDSSSFMVSSVCFYIDSDGTSLASPDPCKPVSQAYSLAHAIETIIEGKGTISVVPAAKTGKAVTFTIEPEEGYVLSSVKVTDSEGHVITFTDYTFTMPSADVTIEATFVLAATKEEPVNPNTMDIAIALLLMIAMTSGIIMFLEHKKMNEV